MNKNRKGFTIVELVIVIAIIAILAAVLIPTFASLIAKANVSVDTQLVRNLNNALTAEKAGGENNKTMDDALKMTKSAGYDIDTIVSKSGNNIAWDSKNDRFVLIDPNNNTYIYPTENGAGSQTIANPVDFFVIYNEVPAVESQKYSVYLSKNATVAGPITVKVGFDAGENTAVSTVNYKNTSAQTVIIRTNGGSLTVSAPDGTVFHYGEGAVLTIESIANASFHEFGTVNGAVTVKKGHFVVEAGAVVAQPIVIKDTTGAVKVSAKETVTVVVDKNVSTDVAVESEKTVYIDDQTNGDKVTKPENAVAAIEIASEAGFVNKKTDFVFNNTLLDNAANVLNGYYKLTSDVSVDHILFISENATVVLDLNGHKLTSNFDGVSILNLGNLTINDSSADKTGIVHNICTTNTNGNWGHDAVRNYGVLTINGGTFGDDDLNRTNANTEHRGAAVRNAAGQCVINGGYFTCGDNYYTWGSGSGYSYAIRSSGDMVINNATVYGAMNGGVSADAGHIEINNGTFGVSGSTSYYVVANGSGTTTINGGRFVKTGNNYGILGGFNGMPSWDASDALASNGYVVNGGTFIKDDEEVTMK